MFFSNAIQYIKVAAKHCEKKIFIDGLFYKSRKIVSVQGEKSVVSEERHHKLQRLRIEYCYK